MDTTTYFPFNQEAALASGSDRSEEEEEQDSAVEEQQENEDEEEENDEATMDVGSQLSSFKEWFEDDRNISPNQKIPYLMMMMTTLDPNFTLDAPPFNQQKKKRTSNQRSNYTRRNWDAVIRRQGFLT